MSSCRRVTRQRELVLEEVRGRHDHPTADDVFESVRKKMPHISLATVYRNLNILAESGEIGLVRADGRSMRYDGDRSDHVHIICERCGSIRDLPGDRRYRDFCDRTAGCTGYSLVSAEVRLTGVCPECLGKEESDGRRAS
ncbi:MAG TPA: transcriptional repressor [Candidatus Krumholzibacterium sp.]|nr:transcriptional repressor [Candidatus Krumholzibacterium sp.]